MFELRVETIIDKKGKPKKQHYVNEIKASEDEYIFAQRLNELGIDGNFNQDTFVVHNAFNGSLKAYRNATYTPDFIFHYKNEIYVIEVKGFKRGDNSLKNRLADQVFTNMGYKYFVLKWKGSVRQGTKGFYEYSNANFEKFNNKLEHEFFTKNNILPISNI